MQYLLAAGILIIVMEIYARFILRKVNSRLLYLEMKSNALMRLFFTKQFEYIKFLDEDREDDPSALDVKSNNKQKAIKEIKEIYKKALFEELDHLGEKEHFEKINILKSNYNKGFFDQSYPWYQMLSSKEIEEYVEEARNTFKRK